MKPRTAIVFLLGVLAGASLTAPVVAGIVPTWKKPHVTPVVIVDYDKLGSFRPRGNASSLAPAWKQSEVTPVSMVGFQSGSGKFVPLDSDSVNAPAWSVDAVRPWAEVELDSFGDFAPRNVR